MTDIRARAAALREAATPGSRIGLTELARSNAWRRSLREQGVMEIVDRTDTTGYLVSVDAMNELLDSINALESEVERITVQQMFITRGEDWRSGDDLAAAAQESLRRRSDAVQAFLRESAVRESGDATEDSENGEAGAR